MNVTVSHILVFQVQTREAQLRILKIVRFWSLANGLEDWVGTQHRNNVAEVID